MERVCTVKQEGLWTMLIKLLNLLLKPTGLQIITKEDYEKGRRDTEVIDRMQEIANPQCKHGSRVNWCDTCEKLQEDKYYD